MKQLVSTGWLEKNIHKVKILDASWHLPNTDRKADEEFKFNHIKNSIFFDIDKYSNKKTSLPHMLPSKKEWETIISKLGIDNSETFIQFYEKITLIKNRLLKILYKLKSDGKKIGAFGAPAKATTLMYHFGLDKDIIDFIIDDSPFKQGLNSPGLHIPVLSSDALKVEKPDYLLLLAWNFADSIVEKNREFLESGGHFIVPLPQIKII